MIPMLRVIAFVGVLYGLYDLYLGKTMPFLVAIVVVTFVGYPSSSGR